jgi:hypothetical protein
MREVWVSSRPITFQGEVVDWAYGKSHYAISGRTLCGRPTNGPHWVRASSITGFGVDCKRCLASAGS